MSSPYLSDRHRELLTRSVAGICIRGVWTWALNGEPVSGLVNGMLRRGELDADYYAGGHAATRVTDAGRRRLQRADIDRERHG